MNTYDHDAIVIGGSFAGLSAAMQLARARRRVCVVDAGQPRNRFAAASHGFFGQDGEPPLAMIEQARRKLLAYPTVTLRQGTVVSATAQPDAGASTASGFDVVLDDGAGALTPLTTRKLVLAFGVKDGLPDIAGVRERWGASVLHCPYCHGYEFAGQRLGVLYHSPQSGMHAQLIADWGPTTLFLNGETTLEDSERTRLLALGIAVEPARIAALEGPDRALSGVRLAANGGADGRLVPIDALYVAATTSPASPLAEQLGCALDEGPMGPCIRTDANKMTTVPGVYAAGDATLMRHNATLASAEGVLAGVGAHQAMVFGQ
ncbi:NAD(P)/FAD-dependent oxidoreductase [Acidovorax sp. ACV01]|uniref:NAD(P)/FAD-dependent oxidoreductase n=1 Tax=Acidovorax sp. ACV01 TaxID=2769311 RepID=UPI00177B7AC2|nr:NAD(P)/FAD-dependent oxidoreductase [Acidovorax sp. ACV01]MBD9390830.1 NAD(P)/FAD-dependent oxidoreductase [Acidovorax sp. ACV01]